MKRLHFLAILLITFSGWSFAAEIKHSNCLLKGVVSSTPKKESLLRKILQNKGYILSYNDEPGLYVTSFADNRALGYTQITYSIVDATVHPSKVIKSRSQVTRRMDIDELHEELMYSIPDCVIR